MIRFSSLAEGSRLSLEMAGSSRFLPWIMALSAYLAAMSGVGLIATADGLRGVDASLAGTMTLQVPAEASAARLNTVLALLRQTRGIVDVHLLEASETARLIEPWLGPSVTIEHLPVPRLIDLRTEGVGADLADLRQKLAAIVPEARLDEHGGFLDDRRNTAARLTGVIAAVLTVLVFVTVLSVRSSARTDLLLNRQMIELLDLLGAEDDHFAQSFQARALWSGLFGGIAGASAAALTIFALDLVKPSVPFSAPALGVGVGDWRVWAVLVGAAIAAGGLAMATARITVLRSLARMP